VLRAGKAKSRAGKIPDPALEGSLFAAEARMAKGKAP
jgi:hypothetical protein